MKKSFRKYYFENIRKDLEEFEKERLVLVKKLKIIIIFILIIVIPINILIVLKIKIDILFISLNGLVITGYYYYQKSESKDYVRKYKNTVIKKLVKFLDESINYTINGGISENKFLESKLFKRSPDNYSIEDYFWGKIDKTEIEFSEVKATYETKNSKGRKRNHTIFDGIFFIADFNKEFNSFTQVFPDKAQSIFGKLGQSLQKMSTAFSSKELVQMEDQEFEKYFAVYSPNQVEARYLLSPKIMEEMVKLRKKAKKDISLSFNFSKLYIAIPFKENLFEPQIFKTIIDFDHVNKYFSIIEMLVNIVHELDLNTRIWTKE